MKPPSFRACAVIATLAFAACASEPQWHGSAIDPPREVAPFEFSLPTGAVYSTAAEAGRPMVVFFGYTHCPDVCPLALADWKRVKSKLGDTGSRVRFVFVTVDPERDSPVAADRYARQFDSTFVGLSGNATTTEAMLKAFGAQAFRDASADSTNYSVTHTGHTFLVTSKGRLVALYPMGSGWEPLLADLKSLL